MSLVTRCPVCGTAFRVHSSQLAAHSGTVRCGKCGGVFNGVAALVVLFESRLRETSVTRILGALSTIQMDLLRRKQAGDHSEELNYALGATINGIAAGLHNTG